MKRTWAFLTAAIFITFLLALTAPISWGQASTSLRGTVTDPSGAAIPNATVHLINTGTNLERTASSDAEGNYTFLQVQPGDYRVVVEANGFSKYEQTGLQLLVNLPASLNIKLKIGATSQTVTVTEQAPLLNTTDASQGITMAGNEIQNLPLEARNVVQLLSLQPGVVYTSDRSDLDTTTDTRSGAVNGERSDQSNVTLDGVDVNDQGTGAAFTSVLPITVDSVQEFRVTTSNYGADEGRSAGSEVALVTRGGTNIFHGSLYEYNRSSLGEANDFFIKSAEAAQGQPNVAPQLIRNVFGGSIGGPVKHDRLFFFLNYEGHRIAQASSVVREIPTQTLRDGIIEYNCEDPTACTGGTVMGNSGKMYNVLPGNYALDHNQITTMDPLHMGPNPAVLKFFNTYPLPNDQTVGDGLNLAGYRFAGAQPERDDWLIGRVDYKLTANGNESLFWRGSGQDDVSSGAPFLPGTGPETQTVDLSKGMVAGITSVITPSLVNNFRYGLTRQSVANAGDSTLPWNGIRNLDEGVTRGNSFQFPVHNFIDNLSWTRGNHSFSFGTNILLVRNGSQSELNSFSDGSTNAAWLNTGGFANRTNPLNPSCTTQDGAAACGTTYDTFPQVSRGFNSAYDFPLIGMLGMVTEVDAQYNFHVNSNGSANALAQGAPVNRKFALDEYELYVQDSWKIRPNLTFNYGMRYELMSPPWEQNGQEVAPNFSLGSWFNERSINQYDGVPSNLDPPITFDLAGKANHRTDLWGWQKHNFAPRISVAWSPQPSTDWLKKIFGEGGQSVIRAGAGMYYDHFGEGMLSTFDQNGSFGLSSLLTNPAQTESVYSSPRLTSMNVIPKTDYNGNPIFTPAPPAGFPQTFPEGNFCICWGLDSSLKTPYSYALDLSVQRQFSHNMSIEVAYTGHLGHRLMVQDDLATPKNLKDPASGITYFQAAQEISKLARENGGAGVPISSVTNSTVKTSAYWQDLMQQPAPGDMYNPGDTTFGPGCGGPTADITQAVYAAYLCNVDNETTGLFFLDVNGIPGSETDSSGVPLNFYYANTGPFTWYNSQYSSLYAWRSISTSSYHALEVTFKKQMSQGLRLNLNYTYSHSIDIASDAERVGEWGGLGGNVINSWDPNQLRGSSDFDLRHQINANWNWDLPFGIGRPYANHLSKGLDAIIGGWQISGITRWSSGFPVNVATCFCFETDWQLSGPAIATAPVSTGRTLLAEPGNGGGKYYNIFPNGPAAVNNFTVDLPGNSGARNQIRGDGFLGTDFELTKMWKMPYNENHQLRFTWDTFNAFNIKRFNVQNASLELDNANTFGNYTHLLTNPRVMQFGLRYEF